MGVLHSMLDRGGHTFAILDFTDSWMCLAKGIVLAYPTSHVYWCMVSVENTVCAGHKCFCIYMVLMPHK